MGNRGIDPFHSPKGWGMEKRGISEAFHERTRGGEGLKAISYGGTFEMGTRVLHFNRVCCGRNFRARTALGVGIVAADFNLRYL